MTRDELLFGYKGSRYPDYLKRGNAAQFITPTALKFCRGKGLDVGCGAWPFSDATPIDIKNGCDALTLPVGLNDYIFSSHCLEHLANPVTALEHWRTRLKPGGVLFLYLPHPAMEYWRPENCRKHLHMFYPDAVVKMLRTLGFVDVIHGERDLAWSFAVVAFSPTF